MGQRGQGASHSEKLSKNREKRKTGKKRGEIGKDRKNPEEKAKTGNGSFTLPLLIDRAGYTIRYGHGPNLQISMIRLELAEYLVK